METHDKKMNLLLFIYLFISLITFENIKALMLAEPSRCLKTNNLNQTLRD